MRFKEQRAIRRRRKNPGHFKTRLFLKGRLGNKETRAKILKEFKPIVSVTYENENISIKNSLPYLKCVLRLPCVVHGPIYGRFMGF